MKKLFFTLLLVGCMTTSFAATSPATSIAGGDGTDGNPYQISSIAELLFMRDKTNSSDEDAGSYRSAHYSLTNNLDMTGENDWIPISRFNNFSGTFAGNGHAISNLNYGTSSAYSNAAGDYIGLFGQVKNGTITNLEISNLNFYSLVANSNNGTGGIVGSFHGGTIDNCIVSGTLMTKSNDELMDIRPKIGGIVGRINTPNEAIVALITNCFSNAEIRAASAGSTGRLYAGGIAGFISGSNNTSAYSKVINCYSGSNVTIIAPNLSDSFAGGIAGELSGSVVNMYVTNCYSYGNIYTESTSGNASGIVGRGNSTTASITNCIALNNSLRFYRHGSATNPTRILRKSSSVPESTNNFGLQAGEGFMVFQRYEADEWKDRTPISDASDVDGETLVGETKTEQIALALSKLNAYVAANPTVDGVPLENWAINASSEYPVFDNISTSSTQKIMHKKPLILTHANGFEVIEENLFLLEIFNLNGQIIKQINADANGVYVHSSYKGIVLLRGSDKEGNRLFSVKHAIL